MKLINPNDAIHRSHIYRLLIEIADDSLLARSLVFKGGTCAALLKKLDRFSVDLDFDLLPQTKKDVIAKRLEKIFSKLGFEIKDSSQKVLQYYLRYKSSPNTRNTLKIDAIGTTLIVDAFSPQLLTDIDRYLTCQNIETMFAHKLVALTDRWEKNKSIAARDAYDLHYFFLANYKYCTAVIEQRTGMSVAKYLTKLISFIEKHITQTVIDEDLNMLLTYESFTAIRKTLKLELVQLLKEEIEKLQ